MCGKFHVSRQLLVVFIYLIVWRSPAKPWHDVRDSHKTQSCIPRSYIERLALFFLIKRTRSCTLSRLCFKLSMVLCAWRACTWSYQEHAHHYFISFSQEFDEVDKENEIDCISLDPTELPDDNPHGSSFSTSLPFCSNRLVSYFFISTSSGKLSLQSSRPPKYLNTTLESKSLHAGSSLVSS